ATPTNPSPYTTLFRSIENERASSTAVRRALSSGNLEHAAAMLGRPFAIAGRVSHGSKLGRSLGFPTANIHLRRMPPVSGIFAVRSEEHTSELQSLRHL